jgi:transcription elongation factor Elf1
MEQEQIKPCPHCGGMAALYSNYNRRTRSYFVFVKCEICGSQGKIYNSRQEPAAVDWINAACDNAIAAWNMRTTEQEATA